MQFSYLSISSLNHMERFDFSNTYGEMSSLSTLQRLKKKAEQKANKSPRKQIHQFYLSRCSGLTYNLSQKCILPIAKQLNLFSQILPKKQTIKKQLAFDKKSHIYLFVIQVLNFTSVLSDEPLGNMFT